MVDLLWLFGFGWALDCGVWGCFAVCGVYLWAGCCCVGWLLFALVIWLQVWVVLSI